MLYSGSKKIRTSELNYHTKRCICGRVSEEAKNTGADTDIFGRVRKTILASKDKTELNSAVTNLVLSTLRPYELANEPFLIDLLSKAMEIGSRYGGGRGVTFDLRDKNKLISGDGVRKNLDRVYDEVTRF